MQMGRDMVENYFDKVSLSSDVLKRSYEFFFLFSKVGGSSYPAKMG